MRGGKLKEVTLPSGGKVTVPDDGKPFEVVKVPGGEGIRYGNGSTVTFRSVRAAPKSAAAGAPALTQKQLATALVKAIAPVLKAQNAKIKDLTQRLIALEVNSK